MTFNLYVAQPADIPQIRELIANSVRGLQQEYTADQREAALQTVFTVDSQLVQDGTYFLAVTEDGLLAGCGGWSGRKKLYGGDHQLEAIAADRLNPAADAARIRAIFVDPAFARRGLGTLLLEAAERAAAASGFFRFEMGSTLAGVPLYRLNGYKEAETIHVPVGHGLTIPVVKMTKSAACVEK